MYLIYLQSSTKYSIVKGSRYDPVNNYNYVEDTNLSVSIKKLMPTN